MQVCSCEFHDISDVSRDHSGLPEGSWNLLKTLLEPRSWWNQVLGGVFIILTTIIAPFFVGKTTQKLKQTIENGNSISLSLFISLHTAAIYSLLKKCQELSALDHWATRHWATGWCAGRAQNLQKLARSVQMRRPGCKAAMIMMIIIITTSMIMVIVIITIIMIIIIIITVVTIVIIIIIIVIIIIILMSMIFLTIIVLIILIMIIRIIIILMNIIIIMTIIIITSNPTINRPARTQPTTRQATNPLLDISTPQCNFRPAIQKSVEMLC